MSIPESVWLAARKAAAFDPDTVLDLRSEWVRGPYFARIRAAMDATLEREGMIGLAGSILTETEHDARGIFADQ